MNQCKNNRVPERRGEMESIQEFEPREEMVGIQGKTSMNYLYAGGELAT